MTHCLLIKMLQMSELFVDPSEILMHGDVSLAEVFDYEKDDDILDYSMNTRNDCYEYVERL